MILRQWKARATPKGADLYREHFVGSVYPELTRIDGFKGAELFARDTGSETELTVETRWASMEAIRAFAGEDPEQAVVEPRVAEVVIDFDRRVSHHDRLFQGKGSADE
jgi:heme-degrading monooxygenase HmoA